MNILRFNHRNDLRQWLYLNSDKEKECWVVCKRGGNKVPEGVLSYLDVVEEALCFGWIDSTIRTAYDGLCLQRLSPRRTTSQWTELNKERCRRLVRLGLMTDKGKAVLPDMDIKHFKIDNEILSALRAEESVWNNFQNFPPLYKRVRIDTIQYIKKRNKELFEKRLKKFIENTRNNIMYGQWNDDGKL